MAAAQAVSGYRQVTNIHRTGKADKAGLTEILRNAVCSVRDWFADPFFWDLYEAERSADSHAMSDLYRRYSL